MKFNANTLSPNNIPSHQNKLSPTTNTIPQLAILRQSTHPMITRAKVEILKPKTLTSEPKCTYHISIVTSKYVIDALNSSKWKQTMKEEYNAVIKNGTLIPVPCILGLKVVGSKWIFKIKYNTDGSMLDFKPD